MDSGEFDKDQTRSFTALTPGAKVSHYIIERKIGAGGMGEVYLARDESLDRDVALKFLPHDQAQDSSRRERFKREALAAAKLSHPNIVHVYDVGEYERRPFFAMEYIEGRSLREVMTETEIGVARAINIILQIAEALETAHAKGIIHRDLKPSNILIDSADRAKIVDFGLSAIQGYDHLTRTGTTLGTLGYMSPEQLRGEEVDSRSDLFSLGVVFYEILTRRNPFRRESEAATIRAVSDVSPEPMARYKADLPLDLQKIVEKLLNKDRSLRYQHASDLAADLKRFLSSESTGVTGESPGKLRTKWLALIVVVLLIATITTLVLYLGRSEVRIPREIKRAKITSVGNATICKPSPSNSEIAFISQESPADSRLMIQDLKSGSMIEVFRDLRITDFDWSPDGSRLIVASVNANSLYSSVVSRVGNRERTFPVWGVGVSWSPDGSRIAYLGLSKQIVFLRVATGDSSSAAVSGDFEQLTDIHWLNDNQHLLIAETHDAGCRIQVVDTAGRLGSVLADSVLSPWFEITSDDQWLYFSGRGGSADLFRLQIDPSTYRRVSDPVLVASGLSTERPVSVSRDGKQLYYSLTTSHSNLWRVRKSDVSSSPLVTTQLTRGSQMDYNPSISPDKRSIAFARKSGDSVNIFTLTTEGDSLQRITFAGHANNWPIWSPSGKDIAYIQWDHDYSFVIAQSNGTLKSKIPLDSLGDDAGGAVWAPGQQIAFVCDKTSQVGLFDPSTHTVRSLLTGVESIDYFYALRFSPDGNTLAMAHNRFLPGERGEQTRESSVGLLEIADGKLKSIADHETDLFLPIDWSPDGRYVICEVINTRSHFFVERLSVDGLVRDTLYEVPWPKIPSPIAVIDDSTYVCTVEQTLSDIWALVGVDASN